MNRKRICAWLTFYHYAQSSPDAARLLSVYFARLHSNLAHALCQLTAPDQAQSIATGAAALIDGLYLRYGQNTGGPPGDVARDLVERYIDDALRP